MFFVAEQTLNWKKFFGYTYLHMLLWNLLTTWWVAKASVPGGMSAFIANSLIMCFPWLLYFFSKKKLGRFVAALALLAYWVTYEYIHHNWDLSWPWLSLGNVFATNPGWVQWYEYTGTTGGSTWILLSNILAFHFFKLYKEEGRNTRYFKNIAAWGLTLCLPIIISLFIQKENLTLQHNKYNVVVVQPNIDPWDEKFEAGKEEAQLQKLVSLSQQQIDANTALVVWPETAIPFQVDESKLKENFFLKPMWGLLKQNPQINLLTGIEGFKPFDSKVSRYANKLRNGGYYEKYNSALLADSATMQIHHKSKLVPGPEVLPAFLSFLAPLFDKFGGTMDGYARDSVEKVLATTNNSFNITPAVCYESIYGDYLADFNRKGSNIICVITNDGWWGDTQGYKQHMNYARLRAIESRKWVARSANTGISCFIDPNGNIVQQLPWNTQGAIKQTVAAFVTETFYTKYGDWLSKFMSVAAMAFLLLTIFKFVKSKSNGNKNDLSQ